MHAEVAVDDRQADIGCQPQVVGARRVMAPCLVAYEIFDLPARSDFRSGPHLIIRDPGDARRDALHELDAVGNRREVIESVWCPLLEVVKVDHRRVAQGRPSATPPFRPGSP